MSGIWKQLLNVFLPPRCLKCGRIVESGAALCPDCFNEMHFISAPYCQCCGRPFENAENNTALLCGECLQKRRKLLRMSRAAFVYNDVSKPLVINLKFHDKTENAGALAQMMYAAGHDIWQASADLIIPVPLHYLRLIKRRYNQAGLLAGYVSRYSGIPVNYDVLCRCRHTRPQVEFSGHARIKNVKNAFAVRHPEKVKGKRIVLVDDVMTTGSTLRECAVVLKKAGAKSVDTLTAARVI